MRRATLERRHGRHRGRAQTPPVGLPMGGDFGRWLRETWSEVVGTDRPTTEVAAELGIDAGAHRMRGVDVAVMFWSDEAEAGTDRTAVAQYLAREAGKARQKQPPPGFTKVGRFYGVWGKSVGFRPQARAIRIEPRVAQEVEARLARWVNWKLHVLRTDATTPTALLLRRPGDGVTAFGLGPDQAARILRWSEAAAARKQLRRPGSGAGGEAVGDPEALARQVDAVTGEIRSASST